MIKRLIYSLLFIVVAVYTSCKKETTVDIGSRAVIVAYLVAGQPVSMKVYQQKAFDDTASYGALITGLKPEISDGTERIELQETATGTYTYANAAYLQTGKTYTLQFAYNNEQVSATTTMPVKSSGYTASKTTLIIPRAVTGPGSEDSVAIVFRWNNPDSLYHILTFKNDEISPFTVVGARNNAPVNFSINAKQTAAYEMYYRTFNYIGTYRAILFTVNKEYADILESNANTSSQQLTNPPGNITNGYGIFTAMQADTIKLELSQ
ncbi:hypothetical protein GCM10023149_10570 [Mucilaginibacter gynuensis]|uniref:DUF4249 domain-containing protein n=1 Tax=Mucilaginibacter gynuensis TaxID=1302236 RepID=A0ABP8FZU9_9SPHI